MNQEIPIHERRVVYRIPGMDKVNVHRDLTYKSVEGLELKLDIYTPRRLPPTRVPIVVFIHGGPVPPEWPPATHWGQYRSWGELMAASDLAAVTFCHRFDDYAHLEQAGADVVAAVDYVRKHASAFNLDPDRLCLWTCSAGGPFISFALLDRPAFVRCIVIYYALLDLRPLEQLSKALSAETLQRFSPAACLSSRIPFKIPIFIARAGLDKPALNQTVDLFLREALANNIPLDFMNHAQGHHAFDALDNDARSKAIIARTIEFIRTNMGMER